ncbi:MAG: GAF domain-containing protein [Acidobacteria bacterium]|nr:GAF domain-containing protein [Acidobacteriota bacterium]MCI0718597.1 GAF domain-containing protein [Acidobacteriota bacterium]
MGRTTEQERQLQQAFRAHIKGLCHERVSVLYHLGIVLLPLFGILDCFIAPAEHLHSFLILRLVAAVILLAILLVAYPAIGKQYPELLGIAGPPIVGGSISLMTIYLGGYESPYYAGLNLVILGVTLVMPFSVRESAVTCALVYTTYFVPNLFLNTISRPELFLNNNFFILGTIVIALTSSHYSQKLRFHEFRSRRQLSLTNEKLTALDEEKTLLFSNLGNLIIASLDSQNALLSVLKLIKENFGFDRAACLRCDPQSRSTGKPVVLEADDEFRIRLQRLRACLQAVPRFALSMRTGEPVILSLEGLAAKDSAEHRLLEELETQALAVVPLRENGTTAWVLLVDYGHSHTSIPEEKFRLLVNLAQPISAALDKARLFESEKKRTAQLVVIHNISRSISSILDFNSVFREFAGLLQRHFQFSHISIYGLDDRDLLVLSAQVEERSERTAIPAELSLSEDSVIARSFKRVQTVQRNAAEEEAVLQGTLLPDIKSQLCIPFQHSSKTLGVINIESEKHLAFDAQDVTVIETLGDYLATWVNNANLYSDIGRKANALQTLNSIGKAISSELNINNLFELIYSQVRQVLNSEDFFIALLEKGHNRIEVKFEVSNGRRRSYVRSLSQDSLVGYVMQTRTPFLVKDHFEKVYEAVTGRKPHLIAQSWLGVPLILGEEALGVIVLQNFRTRPAYDRDDLNFLSTIADQAAVAIANARLFREAQERATRLAVVNEITREASLNLDVDKLFEKITTQLKRVVSFEKSSIAIYQHETDTFSLVNVYGENITAGFYKGMQIPGRETVMKVAYDTKKPYYTRSLNQNVANSSPYLITQGIQSAVSIPIISEDICLGTLNLGSQKEDGFSSDQIDLIQTIANGLGNALKNARLYTALEQSYSELQTAQEQLIKSEKLRALGEMSAGVAHDFNNMLGAILGRAQLMKTQVFDPSVLRGLDIIEKAAIDGAATIRRLQDFTRKRTDQVFKYVDLVQVIEDTLSMTRTRWETSAHVNGIQYNVTTQFDAVMPIAGESSELIEVLTNIIFNALDAMPTGGSLHIRAGTEDERVFASVTDTGRGMSEEIRRRVFDPFFTTKGVKGNGLGMSVAYGIVNRHKGEIEIESEVGKGTTVRIFLPVNSNALRETAEAAVLPQKKMGRFLIVDDEDPIRDLLAEMLVEQGHEVHTASGGREGLEIFKARMPDLVITDLGMPEVSGWDVATGVKALSPTTSVILMTGWGITLDKERAREKGVDVILSKPFQISEIQKVLNEMLELRYTVARF